MDLGTKTCGSAVVVSVGGRVDATTAPELSNKLTQLVGEGQSRMVLSLDRLEYVSSAGLRAFLATAKLINAKNGKLVLSGLQGSVKQVFEISGLLPIFNVVATEAEALRQF